MGRDSWASGFTAELWKGLGGILFSAELADPGRDLVAVQLVRSLLVLLLAGKGGGGSPPDFLGHVHTGAAVLAWDTWGAACSAQERVPLHALRCQAGGAQCLLDVGEPLGGFQLAQPTVHAGGGVAAGLHQPDEALLEGTASAEGKEAAGCWVKGLRCCAFLSSCSEKGGGAGDCSALEQSCF